MYRSTVCGETSISSAILRRDSPSDELERDGLPLTLRERREGSMEVGVFYRRVFFLILPFGDCNPSGDD